MDISFMLECNLVLHEYVEVNYHRAYPIRGMLEVISIDNERKHAYENTRNGNKEHVFKWSRNIAKTPVFYY